MPWRRGVTGLHHDRTDEGGGKGEAQTEVWPFLRGGEDLTDAGQLDRSEQILGGIVAVATLTEKDLFAALGNHAHGWLDHTVNRLQRRGGAGQVQSLERLDGPIFADGSPDPYNQFLAVGLHPLCLVFWRLLDHHIHRNLFSCFSVAHLEDFAESDKHFRQSFYHPVRRRVYNTSRQRTCLSTFTGIVKEFRKWTSKEVAHSLPAKDRPSTLPALYALTPCSRHPIRHARSAPVSRSSPALGQHGTATRWARP